MSGFLPDIASWALGGGGGNAAGGGDGASNNNNNNDENENNTNNETNNNEQDQVAEEPTADEMRAKRMARLAALEQNKSTAISNDGNGGTSGAENAADATTPMDIDKPSPSVSAAPAPSPMEIDNNGKPKSTPTSTNDTSKDVTMEPAPKKKIKAPPTSPADPLVKLRRRKVLLLRRVLLVTVGDNASDRDPKCVHLSLDDDDIYNVTKNPSGIQVCHIAELLAARLSLSPSSRSLETMPPQTNLGLIGYLGGCHKRAGEEMKELKHGGGSSKKKDDPSNEELCEVLDEIRSQVVSYAATSLMVPDLFELGSDAPLQLAKCLSTTSTDPTSAITFDALGKNTSFYYSLCEELYTQDADSFESVVRDVVKYISDSLSKCTTLLDEGSTEGVTGNGLLLTSALRELCTNKKAAVALTNIPTFLVPCANTPEAAQSALTPEELNRLRTAYMVQAMSGRGASNLPKNYNRRSGPALENKTVLGLVLRLGFPAASSNSAMMETFQNPATRSPKDLDQTTDQCRRQLELYQNKCNQLVKQLVVSGEESRKQVIQWFTDALLLNVTADADGTPDRAKVSSEEFLFNLSAALLKLCQPFVNDPKKTNLVDPGFVSSPESHGGVYDLKGDNALPRLGANVSDSDVEYNPKNSFIPLCFFFCSRSLALSIIPGGNRYKNVAIHVSHAYHDIRQENGDARTNRRFNALLAHQYMKEIIMKSQSYITDAFRFYNMAAGIFLQMEKEVLKTMPEHFVADMCTVLVYGSKFTPKFLSGVDFGNLFRLTVKLLSKDCAHLIRNYNLRAKLGDVLHDIFLPGNANRRGSEVPESVTCDPLTGGRPYLTSDKSSIETLAPSLLLLYGEVENTGYYAIDAHRIKIAALLKYLWDSPEHKPAFKRISEDKTNFIVFANGIVNEMNDKFAKVMERLPAIRTVQVQMANPQEWAALSEEDRETISERHTEDEEALKRILPLCNSVLKMIGFLNTDSSIRDMFLLPDMCPRLANMLLHVLNKLVGARGLDLKVDNPEVYNFRPKEMLQDLCVVFSSFAAEDEFQMACAKSGYYTPDLMNKSVKTCRKLGLLAGDSMELFALLATKVEEASATLASDEDLTADAPDEFLDPLTQEFLSDPVILPTSDTIVDRATITQHLLNDSTDPFNRKELSIEDVIPAIELKEKMKVWLDAKKAARDKAES